MDRVPPATPRQRDIMFCHACSNEWYRDEHGFQCPQCDSEFSEVIEATNDPRDSIRIPHGHDWAEDPDEEDPEQYDAEHPYGAGGFRARFERTGSQDGAGEQQAQGGGFMSFLGSAVRLASEMIQPGPGQNPEPGRETQSPASPAQSMTRSISPDGTTVTRHVHGNGYSFTIATSRTTNNLQPRDPHNPQPFNQQPNDINDMMRQIFTNIGGFPGGAPGGMAHDPFLFGPNMGGAHRGAPPFPGGLFQLLGLPLGGVHGDAVYSQEGLDRIITQLMEQHQSGNAPGPATENAIKSLPQRPITEKDLGESGTAECSICMEGVVLNEKVTVLPCEHWFHYDCIEAWLKEHDTCPHCRQGIMPRSEGNAARSPSQPPLNDMRSPENTRSQIPGAYPFPQHDLRSTSSSSRVPGQGANVGARFREAFGGNSPSSSSRPE